MLFQPDTHIERYYPKNGHINTNRIIRISKHSLTYCKLVTFIINIQLLKRKPFVFSIDLVEKWNFEV
jgi:hypothetical protein